MQHIVTMQNVHAFIKLLNFFKERLQDFLLCSALSAASHILRAEITSSSAKSLGYL